MAYSKTNWQDLPNTTTPINATRLNNIETGIENNDKRLNGTSVAGEMIVDSIRTKNMFDRDNAIYGRRIGQTGSLVEDVDYISSEFIEIEPNTTFTISRATTYSPTYGCYAFYDSSKTFITRSGFYTATSHTFNNNSYSNAKYIMVCDRKENINSLQLEVGSSATTYKKGQNFDNKEVYSTGETVIGTWIDGKPLYRKVYTTDTYSTTNNISISNVKEIIDVKGKIQRSDYQDIYQTIPGRTNNTNFYAQFNNITVSQNLVSVAIEFGSSLQNSIKEIAIILEYTKTTD